MKEGHAVVIGKGSIVGKLISWTDCQGKKSAQYDAPPYWVEKSQNCTMTAQAFGVEEKNGKYVVANAKEFTKYFPQAQKGDEVSFAPTHNGVRISLGSVTMELASDIAPRDAPIRKEQRDEVADDSDIAKRLNASARVLDEIMSAPDKAIPEKVMEDAKCIAVVPSMVKIAVGFGGNHGKGVAVCRLTNGYWSAPAPITITGGSWGPQLGGQAVDLVLVVMNSQGMERLLSSKFKIGADASAAAGPIGRNSSTETDWKMKAEVLTYSRARGLFAGIDLSGSTISQDKDETRVLYRKAIPFGDILGGRVRPPAESESLQQAVRKYTVPAGERGRLDYPDLK
jgi:lipid-binding SYLF domain-containing protein